MTFVSTTNLEFNELNAKMLFFHGWGRIIILSMTIFCESTHNIYCTTFFYPLISSIRCTTFFNPLISSIRCTTLIK